ncbi:unnamed protein product [Mycena citricolor]|uniref:Uncharacterized protein n=1 Tax=Mycena citricolor TaxID=2018698 RepID=A0AAD2H4F6_9AGAR|nr:unnamed protein product [Mycena citricolor]
MGWMNEKERRRMEDGQGRSVGGYLSHCGGGEDGGTDYENFVDHTYNHGSATWADCCVQLIRTCGSDLIKAHSVTIFEISDGTLAKESDVTILYTFLRSQSIAVSASDSEVASPSLSPRPNEGGLPVEPDPSPKQTTLPPAPIPPPVTAVPTRASAANRPTRICALPARFRDYNPVPLTTVQREAPVLERRDGVASQSSSSGRGSTVPRVTLIVRDTYQTLANVFGLWRSYLHRPTYDPDEHIDTEDLSTCYPLDGDPDTQAAVEAAPGPIANRSLRALWGWFNNSSIKKTKQQFNELIDVITHQDFEAAELVGTSAAQADKEADQEAQGCLLFLANMKTASVTITVPSGLPDVPSRSFAIPGLQFRSLTSVIKAAFADPISAHFHFSPFKLYHNNMRVYTEVYNSDAFIEEHDKIQRMGELPPDEPDCKLEKVIAAMMQWSDSTHLTNFGIAKLWPIYVLFRNLSKYMQSKPGFEQVKP